MRREEKKKLSINRRIIVNHLKDLESVIDYLITKQIFKSSMRQEINKASQIKADRIRHTLDLLETKQVLAYQYFLEALVVTGNKHVADILEPDYSSSEQCRMVIERERIRGFHYTNEHACSSSSSSSETVNLRFPVACSQNQANESPYLSPSNSSNILSTNNQTALQPMHIQRIMNQNPFYLFNNTNSNFSKQQNSNLNSMSSQSTSRSTSSSGCQSNSMSPTISRSRSSSVTAFLNGGRHICNSASANGLLTLTASSSSYNNTNTPNNMRTPISVSGSPYDDSDQNSPSNYNATNLMRTPTYNIDWSDVNNLELDFHVQTSLPNIRKQLSPNECYQMEQNPRGYCLIINNEYFYDENNIENTEMRRYGTDMDASRLKNLFEKLRFQVEMFVDLREIEMRRVISEFANECEMNANAIDAICLIVLSHGTDGYIYGVDFENKINMDKDILNIFDDILIGKPKLFIFQACRGDHLNQKEMTNYVPQPNTSSQPTSFSSNAQPLCSLSSTSTSKISSSHHSSILPSNLNTNLTPTPIDEETIKKFRQLKMSSNSPANIQLMFKKNKATTNSSPVTSSSIMTTTKTSPSCSLLTGSNHRETNKRLKTKTRSRSHSRGKYYTTAAVNYLATAATAVKNAIKTNSNNICEQSPRTNSTQTQTSFSLSVSPPVCLPESFFTKTFPQTSTSNTVNKNENCYYYPNNIIATNQSINNFTDGRPIKTSLPSRSDFFIWYSSVRGFASHRDVDGSPFIKCLVTVFSKCAYDLELIEMVAKVNMLMQQYEKRHFDEKNAVASYFMVPVAEYHLAKKFYFNP